jgi:hypothetical protein
MLRQLSIMAFFVPLSVLLLVLCDIPVVTFWRSDRWGLLCGSRGGLAGCGSVDRVLWIRAAARSAFPGLRVFSEALLFGSASVPKSFCAKALLLGVSSGR